MRNNYWQWMMWIGLLLLGTMLHPGCPQGPDGKSANGEPAAAPAGKPRGKVQQPLSAEQLKELSWLKDTPYAERTPVAITLNCTGTSLFLQGILPSATMPNGAISPTSGEAVQFPINAGALSQPQRIYYGADYLRTYVVGHPSQPEILMITNYQADGGPVIDLVWRAAKGKHEGVPYNNNPDLPQGTPSDTFYGLHPVYSWDGKTILVPLRYDGLCLVEAQTGESRYVKYPAYDFSAEAIVLEPLPDAAGKRLAYLSIYRQHWPEDQCKFAVLDLDSAQWVFTTDLAWAVYQAGGPDPLNQPLLLGGSRPTQTNEEKKRQARIGMVDTASGTMRLLQFFGQPVWYLSIDPYGEYVVYMNSQEQALTRLNVVSGKMDLDRRIYDETAKLLSGPHGEPVFIWNRNLLVPAQWNDSLQFDGCFDD